MTKDKKIDGVITVPGKPDRSFEEIADTLAENLMAAACTYYAEPGLGLYEEVKKVGGDYEFEGTVVSVFKKTSGQVRYVVQDDRGVLHIYSAKNLKPKYG